MALIIPHHGVTPVVPDSAYLAPTATVIGDVVLGEHSSIWFNVVLRGDCNYIRVGDRSNIQDNSTIHVSIDTHPTIIGNDVVGGHNVLLHGCVVHDRVLIGMGSIVMDGVEVGEESIIGAGTLLTPGTRIPPRSLVVGRPGRVVRQVTDDEVANLIQFGVDNYLDYKTTSPLGAKEFQMKRFVIGAAALALMVGGCKSATTSSSGGGGLHSDLLVEDPAIYAIESVAILPISNISGDVKALDMQQYALSALDATGKYRFSTIDRFASDAELRGLQQDYDTLVEGWNKRRVIDPARAKKLLEATQYDAVIGMEITNWESFQIPATQEGVSTTTVGLGMQMYSADGTHLWTGSKIRVAESLPYYPDFNTTSDNTGIARTTVQSAVPEPPRIETIAAEVAQEVAGALPRFGGGTE